MSKLHHWICNTLATLLLTGIKLLDDQCNFKHKFSNMQNYLIFRVSSLPQLLSYTKLLKFNGELPLSLSISMCVSGMKQGNWTFCLLEFEKAIDVALSSRKGDQSFPLPLIIWISFQPNTNDVFSTVFNFLHQQY